MEKCPAAGGIFVRWPSQPTAWRYRSFHDGAIVRIKFEATDASGKVHKRSSTSHVYSHCLQAASTARLSWEFRDRVFFSGIVAVITARPIRTETKRSGSRGSLVARINFGAHVLTEKRWKKSRPQP